MTPPASAAQAQRCPFCAIVAGDGDAAVVHEAADAIAFLDRRPLFPGHCLLIPRAHHETIMDLPPGLLGPLMAEAQLLARAVQRALGADGIFLAANNHVSQSVPHLHLHVVPRRFKDGLRGFFWPRGRYAEEEIEPLRARIAAAVAELDAGRVGAQPAPGGRPRAASADSGRAR